MAGRIRCECTGGDVKHTGAAQHWPKKPRSYGTLRVHRRCLRAASVQIARVVTTAGKRIAPADRAWFNYCELCAAAIERLNGGEVERRRA